MLFPRCKVAAPGTQNTRMCRAPICRTVCFARSLGQRISEHADIFNPNESLCLVADEGAVQWMTYARCTSRPLSESCNRCRKQPMACSPELSYKVMKMDMGGRQQVKYTVEDLRRQVCSGTISSRSPAKLNQSLFFPFARDATFTGKVPHISSTCRTSGPLSTACVTLPA